MGTWWYDKDLSAVVTVRGNKVVTVADFGKADNEGEYAALISAAPELLEVLSYWMVFIESEQDDDRQRPWVEKAKCAIAKATGAP